ncbi:MAG: hypothetical protein V2G42_00835 [bacterium JZ-2024 1]
MAEESEKRSPFQEIGLKIGFYARQAGETLSRVATATDITVRIKSRESERNRLLQQLGERLFSFMKQGQAPDLVKVVAEDLFRELERVEVEITTLREELRSLQQKSKKGEGDPKEPTPPVISAETGGPSATCETTSPPSAEEKERPPQTS